MPAAITLIEFGTGMAVTVMVLGAGLALLFTLRANSAREWRNLAESREELVHEKADELARRTDELHKAREDIARLASATDLTEHQRLMIEAVNAAAGKNLEQYFDMNSQTEKRMNQQLALIVQGMKELHEGNVKQAEVLDLIAEKLS